MFSKACMSEMDKKVPDLWSTSQVPGFGQSETKMPWLNSDKILPNMMSDKTLAWYDKSDHKFFPT